MSRAHEEGFSRLKRVADEGSLKLLVSLQRYGVKRVKPDTFTQVEPRAKRESRRPAGKVLARVQECLSSLRGRP